jgi:hypothetical protein
VVAAKLKPAVVKEQNPIALDHARAGMGPKVLEDAGFQVLLDRLGGNVDGLSPLVACGRHHRRFSVPLLCRQRDLQSKAGEVLEPGVAEQEHVEDHPLVLLRQVGVLDPVLDPALLGLEEMQAQDFTPVFGLEKQMPLAFDDARSRLDCERFLDARAKLGINRLGAEVYAFRAGASLVLATRAPAPSR